MQHVYVQQQLFAGRSCARDNIRENIDQNHKQLLEDMGVETDEATGVDLPGLQHLFAKRPRRA